MATDNPFNLLDNDAEDPSLLVAAQQLKAETKKAAAPLSKAAAAGPKSAAHAHLTSKPLPAAQAEAKYDSARGDRGGGRGYGRGRGAGSGTYRDSTYNENSYRSREFSAVEGAPEADGGKSYERGGGYGGSREPFHGSRRGGLNNGQGEHDRPRRQYERRSGTGQGNEIKRDGAGRGNWGTETDELTQVAEVSVVEADKDLIVEKPSGEENAEANVDKEAAKNEVEEEIPEEKQMTLDEYEKVLEEKRKSLQAFKIESRKVDIKEFESMQPLSSKKVNDDLFIKLGSEKEKKELVEREERAKKSMSINEFLKPVEGERYVGGRGRGRGRGSRGGYGGGSENKLSIRDPGHNETQLLFQDPRQFPTLGGK